MATVNAIRYRSALEQVFGGWLARGPVVDAPQWQEWANLNRDFFGPLKPGTRLAIIPTSASLRGVILTVERGRVRAESVYWMRKARIPLLLVMDDQTAEEVLHHPVSEGNGFWNFWKRETGSGRIRVYARRDQERLRSSGISNFLAAINVRVR